ncbi:hypothetical protein [Fodinibius salsisoli]|uniref:Beta-barrel porin-2, OmpL-like. bbp2 n=1 Tax=Fodinibius salsisoli TaxID=2820877 RepID=A0ABT3PHU9_9BACT|nr:hypothetical protein [Fodinibius salsisoli]MCW9705502.1 hypothetical protein [Fodinibius salsisoli]
MKSARTFISHSITLLFIIFGFCYSAVAQSTDQKPDKESTFQVSFVPGLSTSDSYSTSRISFNIIGGYNGAFHGIELGSVFNGNRYDISGLQMSGAVNYNGQQARGLLLSGALNISDTFTGGISLAGAANIVGKHTRGLLMAGGLNVAGEIKGVAFAPINVANNQMGTQFGVINTANRQEGTQIGIINIVGENDGGTPIGLLSFVRNGRFDVDIWGSETGFVNGGMRIGTKEVYNVLSIGYNPFYGDDLWQVGLGLGYHYSFNQKGKGLETDIMNYHLNYDGKWTSETSNHIQWRMHYVHAYTRNVRLFIGPSVNLLITDEELSTQHLPYTIYKHSSGSNELRWWIGGTLGVELF